MNLPDWLDATRRIVVVGGGTISHVRSHFALCAPAYGTTARQIAALIGERKDVHMNVDLVLTRMADPENSTIETTEELASKMDYVVADKRTKIIFFNPAICDFNGIVDNVASGKGAERLRTRDAFSRSMIITPAAKIISNLRKTRKDIFVVGFKATAGATEQQQYIQGLNMLKESSVNLVLANDTVTRKNMIIVPEEAAYKVTTSRIEALKELIDIALLRSHLTFTRSTVVDGKPVPWGSTEVPKTLREVVNHCIEKGAYKKFRGVTAGHFAVKLNDTTFLTSRRKTDFNRMEEVGLVKVTTDGPDSVIAYGSKPSVGGQSQRIVFTDHPDDDCVVHFHCVKKIDSQVPTVSQREFECGSHECGRNTSQGLKKFGNIKAVYLDNHGPNIVFNSRIDPKEVIDFIDANFDLTTKTGGYALT